MIPIRITDYIRLTSLFIKGQFRSPKKQDSRFQHLGGRGGACAGVEILRTKKEESGILLHAHFSTAPVIPKI